MKQRGAKFNKDTRKLRACEAGVFETISIQCFRRDISWA